MCLCNSRVRTPYCGKPGCQWPDPGLPQVTCIVRKPFQLLSHDGFLFALCDDGSVWEKVGQKWHRVNPIPQTEAEEEENLA